MDASWDDQARSSPVPRPSPPKATPSADDWRAEYDQASARVAAEKLETEFRSRLDRLGRQQECAIASCAYLDEGDLEAGLAPLLDNVRAGYERLVGDYGSALRAAAGALPAEDLDARLSRFRDICAARQSNLDSDSHELPGLIGLRGAVERGHAERAWAAQAGDTSAPQRQAVALGVIQGITVLASRLSSAKMAVGLVATMMSAAQALDGTLPMAAAEPPPLAVVTGDDGSGWGVPSASPGAVRARCVCVDTGQVHGAGAYRPLIYLADMREPGQGRDDALAPCGIPAQDGNGAWFAATGDAARPAVGLVVSGPAESIMRGPRGLDAELLASFARSAIFHSSYDGTPRSAAAAICAARALEVVALVDPGVEGGVWADVDPSRQRVAASLVFGGRPGDRLRFFRS